MDGTRATLLEALGLKELDRAGWLRKGIESPESVAAHSWGVAWLVSALCPPSVDRGHAVEMAVVHDVAEVRVGDITPVDGVSEADKEASERAAIQALTGPLGFAGTRVVGLWEEYEAQVTDESRFVRLCDKLDMALQSVAYSERTEEDLSEFRVTAEQLCADWGFDGLLP
jgi:putative hydrolase of HD superfamily